MAGSSDVVKKITRFKLQLSDTAEPATVLKILQKLKNLDVTLDILAETGIGKTVNSLRRHEEAGELAKSIVKGWKSLIPKESKSHEEDRDLLENVTDKDKLDTQSCSENGCLAKTVNNNCLTSHNSNEEVASEKEQCEGQKRKMENYEKNQNDGVTKKTDLQEDKMDDLALSKRKKDPQSVRGDGDAVVESKNSDLKKPRSDSREKPKSTTEDGRFESERESDTKTKPSKETSKESRDFSKPVREIKDEGSESRTKKGKKMGQEKQEPLKHKAEWENKGRSKHKKAKIKHKHEESKRVDKEEPSMSFESYLNYDVNVSKRKEQSRAKKPHKKSKLVHKEQPTEHSSKSHVVSPKQESLPLMDIPLTPALPQFKQPLSAMCSEKKVEKEPDFCDVSEESAVFNCQRLNRKMQVYSGAKTACLPTMMSLYQQCIRTLQNNINLLHETGGVPFEILEPVLERCTPEQLLRIEECNPIYIGLTDHLWEKHCQRDFKDFKLQEYESWKEMYIRMFEERERKLQRLTKTIISAHSKKPQGRQVKMAFIHTVAKPPRDVRIQQEIHGTAVQQPNQHRCSVKVQDNRPKPSCNESSRSSSTSSGGSNTQDPRKKTRVAPMMAKSLKALRKQFGRR
ncbi:elongin A, like [Parambassis ranga]|uniref:Elongin A, like n=1 Tax=Parambassis ranga TaxID=210632 RepID=A0A6P7JS01_9TELE|nr:elongin-A-like [Parambassis ranga]